MDNIESSKIPSHQSNNKIPTSHSSTHEERKLQENSDKAKTSPQQMKIINNKGTRRRFLGVRQRPSGRWVAEIKVSSQKLRLWLGTFDTPEDAAMSYDKAATLLRGNNAKTNFPISHNRFDDTCHENCKLFLNNPRIYRLLQRNALEVSKPKSSSSSQREEFDDLVGFDDIAVVEDTIVCSSSYEDGLSYVRDKGVSNNNKHCTLSLGSSKVYSTVVVAPSFSA